MRKLIMASTILLCRITASFAQIPGGQGTQVGPPQQQTQRNDEGMRACKTVSVIEHCGIVTTADRDATATAEIENATAGTVASTTAIMSAIMDAGDVFASRMKTVMSTVGIDGIEGFAAGFRWLGQLAATEAVTVAEIRFGVAA